MNPAKEHQVSEDGDDFAEGVTYQYCLREALQALLTCDGVALLPGWECSSEAQLEHHVATVLGLDEYWLDDESEVHEVVSALVRRKHRNYDFRAF